MSVTDSVVRSPHQDSLLVPAAEDQEPRPLDYDRGREEIARLVATGPEREKIARRVATVPDYELLFDQMMEVVKDFVEFDWAYLFIFTEGREYSRFICRYGPDVAFLSRWFPTDEEYRDFIIKEETWIDDLESFFRRSPNAAEMLKRPDVKIAIEAGFKAVLAVPVREGGKVIGGLCLYSKQQGIYGAEHRRKLECLMLSQALLPVFHAADRDERKFVSDLVNEIAASKDFKELAQTVVDKIARFYDFHNVSIFKVNVLRGHFRLLAQALPSEESTAIPQGYTQPLEKGLLGLTCRRGSHVLLKNVADCSPEAQAYVDTARGTRSELCIPIKMSGRILWILNVEDQHTEAFTLGEVETLKFIIEQMQANLKRIFQRLVLMQVLDVVPEAVVITEENGKILHCTKDALEMFQRESIESEDNLCLSKFLPGSNAATAFSGLSRSPTLTEVVGVRGKPTSVLAQKFTLEDEYDHEVVVLQDVTEVRRRVDSELFKAALSEAAAQVRVPVSLVSSFVQQIGQRGSKDKKLLDLTRKAMRQLGRIELTYDRVLASYDAQTLPAARKERVDVNRTLDHIISELPELERKALRRSAGGAHAEINADPCRVLFALGSMLAYLLRARADAEPIEVRVDKCNGAVEVSMTGAVQRITAVGELAALVESTRAQIALGEGALTRIAGDCGGIFERRQQADRRERLSLRLTATH